MDNIREKKVAFLIAPKDFSDEEYFQPKVILQAKGIQISTLAKGDPEEVTGMRGGKAHIDAKFSDLTVDNYDALVVVGGQGVKKYFNDKKIHKILQAFDQAGKTIGAICSAPVVLANAGLLTGKKATVFSEDIDFLKNAKAKISKDKIVIDDNIVTANSAEIAIKFGEAVLQVLSKS